MPFRSFNRTPERPERISFAFEGEKFELQERCPAGFVGDLISHTADVGSTAAIIEFLGRLIDDPEGPAETEAVVVDALRGVPPEATVEDRAAAIVAALRAARRVTEPVSRWEQVTRADLDVHTLTEINDWVTAEYAKRPTKPSAG